MSLNCPSTTAVALNPGAGLPILAFPEDMMLAGALSYCRRQKLLMLIDDRDKWSWVEPDPSCILNGGGGGGKDQ